MKKTILSLGLSVVLQLGAYPGFSQVMALAQSIPDKQNPAMPAQKKLKEVLKELKDHYQVDILFFDRNVEGLTVGSKVVSFNVKLEQNLDAVLKPLGLSYKKSKNKGYVIVDQRERRQEKSELRYLEESDAAPQAGSDIERPGQRGESNSGVAGEKSGGLNEKFADRAISGKVTDDKGQTLPGVNVTVKGRQLGTTTDEKGRYSLSIPDGTVTLVFSFVGFLNKEVEAGSQSVINVSLETDLHTLSEVVVVGYGTVLKSALTGSVSSVSSKEITQVKAVSNVAQALQGQVAGVQVIQRSGQPGEYVSIKIRGTNSIAGGNDPLYVVDGLPLDGLSAQLNPDDIEQLEVLKDASATAIYGSRGANGVVMITTKKGKEGKTAVSYSGYLGVQSLRKKIDLINAKEFATLQNEVAKNDGTALPWTQAQVDNFGKGTDWQDEVYRNAKVQSHDISISGGNAGTKYYTSYGYYDQDGIIENSNFTRLSFRGNLDQKISSKLSVNVNMSLQHSRYFQADYPSADGGGVPFQTMVMPATVGVYDASGAYTRFTGVSWGATNPVGTAREKWNPSNNLRILGNAGLVYEIVSGLKLRLNAGIDNAWNKSDSYTPSFISQGQPNGRASKSYNNSLTFVNENLLTYVAHIGDHHNLDLLAGVTYQTNKAESLSSGTANNFLTDIYQNNNIQSATVAGLPSTGYSDYSLVSYLGRVNYNYKSKYYATFTGRYDGSSKFGENNKFAFFPSGALAWRLSEEEFMKNMRSVSNLKLRLSYGVSGNQAISAYQTLSRLNNLNVVFDNKINIGYIQGGLDNRTLKWESTGQFDIGIDLGLLNDRIQFVADYYRKRTKDLLLNVTLPPTTGFGSVLQNIGVVKNQGFEFSLATRNTTGIVKWNSMLTFTHNRTRVVDLGKDAVGNPITYKEVGTGGNWFPMIVGQSLSQLYGYKVLGIYQSDEEAKLNGEPGKKAGDYKFQNTDGNSVVDGNDRITLSHLEPIFTYGFNNTITFRSFDLSLLFVGSYGNDIVNEFRKYNLTMNGRWTPSREAFEQRWVGSGNSVDKPSSNSGSSIRDYANSLWVENGSYIKLRDITLGYNLPSGFLKGSGIGSVRLYASAQNFLTFTKYSGYDPEASWTAASINGWDRGVYPSMKSITGGLKVNF